MAPEVLENDTAYNLPIVMADLLSGGTLDPTQFWYFGNDAIIKKNDYLANYMVFNADSCKINNCLDITTAAGFMLNISGLQVSFTDTSSSNQSLSGWSWDFGDGVTSTEQNPTHNYMAPGAYIVTLETSTSCGSDISKTYLVLTGISGQGDLDGDGVPVQHDICPYGDDNLDTNMNGVPDDCECQGETLTLSGVTTTDQVYVANQTIVTNESIENNAGVTHKAHDHITYNSNFQATNGSTLNAVISACFTPMQIGLSSAKQIPYTPRSRIRNQAQLQNQGRKSSNASME
jgi:PKD repeat protein